MEEYQFDRVLVDQLLTTFQKQRINEVTSRTHSSRASGIAAFLASCTEQADQIEERIDQHVRLKQKRIVDWMGFLTDVNALLRGGTPGLRAISVVLIGPEKWMWWSAPPDDIRNRTYDVIARLVAHPPTLTSLFSAFPSLILLHPFKDANCRSALIFLEAFNRCYQLIDGRLLESICVQLRTNRVEVVQSISRIRVLNDLTSFASMINRIISKTTE